MKKLTVEDLKRFRDRLHIPITDKQLDEGYPPYYHPGRDSDEIQYMHDRRQGLGGYVPTRVVRAKPLPQPEDGVRGREGRGLWPTAAPASAFSPRLVRVATRAAMTATTPATVKASPMPDMKE
ncbi:pyruvate dehydrogenase (acetyl-transferring), homodimeric type [Streptomyces californicus]